MSEIVNYEINITLDTSPIKQAGFGIPLIVGETAVFSVLDVLTGEQGLRIKGLTAGQKYIEIVYTVSGNNTALAVARTGSGTSPAPYVITVTVATDASGNATSTAVDILDALEAESDFTDIATVELLGANGLLEVTSYEQTALEYNVFNEFVDVSDMDAVGYGTTTPEYLMAEAIFSQSPRLDKIYTYYVTSHANIKTDLNTLRKTLGHDDWYWLLITSRDKTDIQLAGDYCQTVTKMGVFGSDDQTIISGRNGLREVYIISNTEDGTNNEYPDAAWIGRCAGADIGSITWDSKELVGISNSGITQSQQSTLLDGNANVIREMGGKNVTWEGKTMSGEYIDVVNSKDWLETRLVEAFQNLKTSTDKIPMTTPGMAQVEATLRAVFDEAGRNGIIAPVVSSTDQEESDLGQYQYILNVPKARTEVTKADRSNRKLSPIAFTAIISGGINKIKIDGTMSV